MITGISHITLIVKNMERTASFFEKIFDAREVYASPTAKYFLIGNIWIALNMGKSLSERTYNHIAFAIDDSDFDEYVDRVKNIGAEILEGRGRFDAEGRSIYFYDYDNHLFELHTGSLEKRLASYNN